MKKTIKILVYIFLIVGILLFLIGLLFHFMKWPDMYKGIFTGPILMGVGIILLLIVFVSNKNKKK